MKEALEFVSDKGIPEGSGTAAAVFYDPLTFPVQSPGKPSASYEHAYQRRAPATMQRSLMRKKAFDHSGL